MCAPQSRRRSKEHLHYDLKKHVLDVCSADELIWCLGDGNGHASRHSSRLGGVHGCKNVVGVLSRDKIVG